MKNPTKQKKVETITTITTPRQPLQLFIHTPTNDIISINNVISEATIGELKSHLELKTGILVELQSLYIGNLKLEDAKTLQETLAKNGIVVRLRIKEKSLEEIYIAASKGDTEEVFRLGVEFIRDDDDNNIDIIGSKTNYKPIKESQLVTTSNANDLIVPCINAWNTFVPLRSFQAMFAAARSGHVLLINELLHRGSSNIEMVSKYKRSVLHIAAFHGLLACTSFLLSKGANSKLLDVDGMSPLTLAAQNGHFKVEKRLWLFNWNLENLKNIDMNIENGNALSEKEKDALEIKETAKSYQQQFLQRSNEGKKKKRKDGKRINNSNLLPEILTQKDLFVDDRHVKHSGNKIKLPSLRTKITRDRRNQLNKLTTSPHTLTPNQLKGPKSTGKDTNRNGYISAGGHQRSLSDDHRYPLKKIIPPWKQAKVLSPTLSDGVPKISNSRKLQERQNGDNEEEMKSKEMDKRLIIIDKHSILSNSRSRISENTVKLRIHNDRRDLKGNEEREKTVSDSIEHHQNSEYFTPLKTTETLHTQKQTFKPRTIQLDQSVRLSDNDAPRTKELIPTYPPEKALLENSNDKNDIPRREYTETRVGKSEEKNQQCKGSNIVDKITVIVTKLKDHDEKIAAQEKHCKEIDNKKQNEKTDIPKDIGYLAAVKVEKQSKEIDRKETIRANDAFHQDENSQNESKNNSIPNDNVSYWKPRLSWSTPVTDAKIPGIKRKSFEDWLEEKRRIKKEKQQREIDADNEKNGENKLQTLAEEKRALNEKAFEKWLQTKVKQSRDNREREQSDGEEENRNYQIRTGKQYTFEQWLESKRTFQRSVTMMELSDTEHSRKSKSQTRQRLQHGMTFDEWKKWKDEILRKKMKAIAKAYQEDFQRLQKKKREEANASSYVKWLQRKNEEKKLGIALEVTIKAQEEEEDRLKMSSRLVDPHLKTFQEWLLEKQQIMRRERKSKMKQNDNEFDQPHPEDSKIIFNMWLRDKFFKELEDERGRLSDVNSTNKKVDLKSCSLYSSSEDVVRTPTKIKTKLPNNLEDEQIKIGSSFRQNHRNNTGELDDKESIVSQTDGSETNGKSFSRLEESSDDEENDDASDVNDNESKVCDEAVKTEGYNSTLSEESSDGEESDDGRDKNNIGSKVTNEAVNVKTEDNNSTLSEESSDDEESDDASEINGIESKDTSEAVKTEGYNSTLSEESSDGEESDDGRDKNNIGSKVTNEAVNVKTEDYNSTLSEESSNDEESDDASDINGIESKDTSEAVKTEGYNSTLSEESSDDEESDDGSDINGIESKVTNKAVKTEDYNSTLSEESSDDEEEDDNIDVMDIMNERKGSGYENATKNDRVASPEESGDDEDDNNVKDIGNMNRKSSDDEDGADDDSVEIPGESFNDGNDDGDDAKNDIENMNKGKGSGQVTTEINHVATSEESSEDDKIESDRIKNSNGSDEEVKTLENSTTFEADSDDEEKDNKSDKK